MGYDTTYDAGLSDHQIAARARAEDRIILTRDREFSKRRGIRCYLVRAHGLEEQIEEVFAALGLSPLADEPRCPRCNALLIRVTPDEVAHRVPAHVLQTQGQFRHCVDCDKVYWQGSHWQNVTRVVGRVLGRQRSNQGRA